MAEREPQQPAPITTDRVIAVFNDYSGLLAAMRLRAEDQKIAITSPDIAKVSGLADALVAKILSPKMPRRLSFQSMHPVLSLLGVRLAMIEDPVSMQKYTSRLKKRTESCVHSGTVHVLISRRELRKRQRRGGQNSRKYMSAAAARALARHAANSRWAAVKAKKAEREARAAKAGTHDRTRPMLRQIRKFLPRRRPHMTQSGHERVRIAAAQTDP